MRTPNSTTQTMTAGQVAAMTDAGQVVRLVGSRGSIAAVRRVENAYAAPYADRLRVWATVTGPAVQADRQSPEFGFASLDWLARVCAPAWLDAAGMPGDAATLRGLAPLLDVDAVEAARETLREVQNAAHRRSGIVGLGDLDGDAMRDVDGPDESSALGAKNAAFWAAECSHMHPAAGAVTGATSNAWTVCRLAAHVVPAVERARVVAQLGDPGRPVPVVAGADVVRDAVLREFGARAVEYGDPVGLAASVAVLFRRSEVLTVAVDYWRPSHLRAGVRPRPGVVVRVECDDTAGVRGVAEFVARRVDVLGCGCWRLSGDRPGPLAAGYDRCTGMEVLTGCGVHPCGVLDTEPEPEPLAVPVDVFADLLAARR